MSVPLSARYMLLSGLGFAFMAAMVKLATQRGIPLLEVVAARALVSLVLSYVDVRRQGLSPWGKNRTLLMARAIVGTLALVCVYYSMATLPLAQATVLQYLHPMFTALIAFLFLKERIQGSTALCLLLSLAGMIVIVHPQSLLDNAGSATHPLALAAAIAGAFGAAIAYVLVRKLSQTEAPSVIIFYFPLVAMPFACLLLGGGAVWPRGWDWGILLLVGIFTQIGQIGLTRAMQTESAGKATAYSYVQVLFAAVLGWVLFDEVPDWVTWVGGGLILLGALINLYRSEPAAGSSR